MPYSFQGPTYIINGGDTIEIMAVIVQDRLGMVKRMDLDSLLDVLMLDDLQTTVRKAAEARARRLSCRNALHCAKEPDPVCRSAIHCAQDDQEHSQ